VGHSKEAGLGKFAAPKSQLSRQIPTFLGVGILGFCVDLGITVALAKGLSLSPYLARPPAVIIATLVTFLLNRAFTFKATSHWPAELARYLVVVSSGQAVNYAVYACALALFALAKLVAGATSIAGAVACGSVAAMFLNFIGFRFFAFRSY
jgi:putative flippase GtrA